MNISSSKQMYIKFNHIALRAKNPEVIKDFLLQFGFEEGERPNFPFEGHWLYSDGKPMIHIFGGGARFRDEAIRGELRQSRHIVDHICFESDNFEETITNIKKNGYRYSVTKVPDTAIYQIFVVGPEELVIEIQVDVEG